MWTKITPKGFSSMSYPWFHQCFREIFPSQPCLIAKGYPLVNVYITMERSTIFHGKTHYFDWAIFNSKLLNYQRVPRMSFLVVSLIRSRNCRVYWRCRFGLAQGFGHHRDPPKNWTVQGPNIFFWSSACIKLQLIWNKNSFPEKPIYKWRIFMNFPGVSGA